MMTHLITYHDINNRILGERILYNLTNEQAVEFIGYLKKWANALFPSCNSLRLESLSSGDVVGSYSVKED